MTDTPPNHYWAFNRKGQLAGCSLGYRLYFCVSKSSSGRRLHEAETDSRLTNGSCAMFLKFQPRRPKHHTKRDRRCRSANIGRLIFLLDLSPADFRRFLTVLVDRRLLESQCCLSTGLVCEWHPSNQTLQCPVVTIRCYSWSAGSWQVFLIVG